MSSEIKTNLKYTKDHEWAEINGNIVSIGITDFAQSALGDIVFLEIPAIGKELVQGSSFGVVESIKSVSDLYAPLSGEVIERNDSFGSWLIKVKIKNESELKNLLSAADYQTHCSSSN